MEVAVHDIILEHRVIYIFLSDVRFKVLRINEFLSLVPFDLESVLSGFWIVQISYRRDVVTVHSAEPAQFQSTAFELAHVEESFIFAVFLEVNHVFKNAGEVVSVNLHLVVVKVRVDVYLPFGVAGLAEELSVLLDVSFVAEFRVMNVAHSLVAVVDLHVAVHRLLVQNRDLGRDIVDAAVFEMSEIGQGPENYSESIAI